MGSGFTRHGRRDGFRNIWSNLRLVHIMVCRCTFNRLRMFGGFDMSLTASLYSLLRHLCFQFAIYVMNQTGDSIKDFVSNLAGAASTIEEVENDEKGGKVFGSREYRCSSSPC